MKSLISSKVSVQTNARAELAGTNTRADYVTVVGRANARAVRVRRHPRASERASFGRVRAGFMTPIMTLTYRLREGPKPNPRRI